MCPAEGLEIIDKCYYYPSTNQSPCPSPLNRNWLEARQDIQVRLYGGFCTSCRREWKQVTGFLHPTPGWEQVEVCPGIRLEGWLRQFALPLGGGMCSTLILLLTPSFCSQLFRNDCWVFLSFLYLLAQNLPQLCMHSVIFSLLQFLCIL